MSQAYKTIHDMMKGFYETEVETLQADAPLISTTTGVLNTVFGAKVWSQLNQTANTFGVLPKYPWPQGGFRVVTARAASSGGGVSEAAALPETIKPTFAEITVTLKEIAHNFEVSSKQQALRNGGDDAIAFEELREQMAIHHAEMMNVMLLTDVDTLASSNLESIDRVVSSYAEVTNCGITANDSDIYGIDRDAAAGWSDAEVLHNSNTDRVLTDALLRSLVTGTEENGANNAGQIWITGHDTEADIMALYQSQVRYSPVDKVEISVGPDGFRTGGAGFGVRVASLYGRPLLVDKDVKKDTKSRVYLLDLSDANGLGRPRLGIAVAQPTLYAESKDMFSINKFAKEGMFFTQAELVCTFFAAQGKIRDLL